jgi:cell wall-associated NlpC family hydrolase
MARYSAVQIYGFARDAGFTPDEAVTMTAIALAESGGRSTAHATRGEDSRGLWQINAASHPEFANEDLWDPRANAAAAFRVARGGDDVSPWTTTHDGTKAAYLRFRSEAQSAAAAYGEPSAEGVWTGTPGYGHSLAAGHELSADSSPSEHASPEKVATEHVSTEMPASAHHGVDFVPANATAASASASESTTGSADLPAEAGHGVDFVPADATVASESTTRSGDLPAEAGHGVDFVPGPVVVHSASASASASASSASGGTTRVEAFVAEALAQRGDRFVMGATAHTDDPNPSAFDCSELVHWASARAGISVPDGALPQYMKLRQQGLGIPVEQAIHTRGALLFSFASPPDAHDMRPAAAHVAISLGNGHTIEARGRAYGVGVFDATTTRFHYAALLPHAEEPLASQPGEAASIDIDHIADVDHRSVASGGALLDTDGDGLSDRQERRLGLDPYSTDTDHDLLSDSYEVLFAHSDPLTAQHTDLSWGPEADAALAQAVPTGAVSGTHLASAHTGSPPTLTDGGKPHGGVVGADPHRVGSGHHAVGGILHSVDTFGSEVVGGVRHLLDDACREAQHALHDLVGDGSSDGTDHGLHDHVAH